MSGSQQNLFADTPWEVDDATGARVATVVFPGPPEGEFDYLVPDHLGDEIGVGHRVRVPLGRGNRALTGYCIAVEHRTIGSRQLKSLLAVVDDRRLLSPAMIRLTRWMADHYLAGWGQVLESVLPAGVRDQAGTRIAKFVELNPSIDLTDPQLKLTAKQRQVIRVLTQRGQAMTTAELARAAGCTQAPVETLIRKGVLRAQKRRTAPLKVNTPSGEQQPDLALNEAQQRALAALQIALDSREHQTLLLHGVTGSGKTEIYIQAIQEVIRFGRQAIVLVPEISLTPQTVERFRARFPRVAVLHSHLSDAERHGHWEQIAAGGVQVVVGARSAIFAPTPHLGLIVLDEEHESSFKQESAPRYHARDVALQRARAEGIPLVLGSATPSLESWQRAADGMYQLLSLPDRIFGRPMPAVSTVDLRSEAGRRPMRGALSRILSVQMEAVLKDGGQIILLLNRRGHSTHIQCPACGHVVRCESCDIALTYHRQQEIALCHYCDSQQPAPLKCPSCGFLGIRYGGTGTQKLEAEIKARFPGHTCLRMDTDAMQAPGSHQRALDRFRSGEVQILLGTQMIAKGLDFPNVTLVGVVNADLALHLPDFRAAERTFQLIAQVAGRAGRGDKPGRVLVQTFSPEHPAIQAAVRHDYQAFARHEMPLREAFGYPPVGEMIRVVLRGPVQAVVSEFATYVGEQIQAAAAKLGSGLRVLGPAAAPMPKLRDKFRYHLQVQGPQGDTLREVIRSATAGLKPPRDVEWMIDVDPLSML